MKTVYKALLVLSLPIVSAKAQKPDTAKLVVHYEFTHIRDTLNRDKPYTENMELLVGPNASQYKSYDRAVRSEQMRKQAMEQINNNVGGPQNFQLKGPGRPLTNVDYYYFLNEHKVFRKEQLINYYIVEEPFESPQWNISPDTTTIAGLHCQKATTHFKGRDYEAWFCSELPFHAGPWKLNGLPGLIVQAKDKSGTVAFKFTGMEEAKAADKLQAAASAPPAPDGIKIVIAGEQDNSIPANVIELPEKGIKTTEKELVRLKDMMRKDPNAFLQASLTGSGLVNVRMANGAAPVVKINSSLATPPVINNPLELPERK